MKRNILLFITILSMSFTGKLFAQYGNIVINIHVANPPEYLSNNALTVAIDYDDGTNGYGIATHAVVPNNNLYIKTENKPGIVTIVYKNYYDIHWILSPYFIQYVRFENNTTIHKVDYYLTYTIGSAEQELPREE